MSTITAGCSRKGSKLTVIVPDDVICSNQKMPLIFHGSYVDGYPFPKLMDLGLKMLCYDRTENKWMFKKIEPQCDEHFDQVDSQSISTALHTQSISMSNFNKLKPNATRCEY